MAFYVVDNATLKPENTPPGGTSPPDESELPKHFSSGADALAHFLESRLVRRIDVGLLSEYSKWPQRLLDPQCQIRPARAKADLQREFDDEKWGSLAARLAQMEHPTIDDADREYFSGDIGVGNLGSGLFVGSGLAVHRIYMSEIRHRLLPHWNGESIVDLGSGYGSVALKILSDPAFQAAPSMLALELTAAGRNCLHIVGSSFTKLTVGACDFNLAGITDEEIRPGSLILTSMATMYMSTIPDRMISDLLAMAPARVVHFEPLPATGSLQGFSLLRKNYLLANAYNTDLLDVLLRHEASGILRVISVETAVAGENALLPATMIVWEPGRPRRRT
jgi:hypothetical protein